MNKKKIQKVIIPIFFVLVSFSVFSQKKITFSGNVSDEKTNEKLFAVSVSFPELKLGTTTDDDGNFKINIPTGNHKLEIQYLGYQTVSKTINFSSNTYLDFKLTPEVESLDEVEIVSKGVTTTDVKKPALGVYSIKASTIKKIPSVGGEPDIIKSIQFLPGVSNNGEGSSGFNVRGGAADQNLILLDGTPVYSDSHLFGFFSVFNADVVNSIKLYKGGIPSKFGGKVSSVLDVYQKNGTSDKIHGTGSIGTISSKLTLFGPVDKQKRLNFMVGGRASYAHLFLKLANQDNIAYFYDLNTKLNYKINDKHHLSLSGYFGRDVIDLSGSFNNTYGNQLGNLNWKQNWNDKLSADFSVHYTSYAYNLEIDIAEFKWKSSTNNTHAKYDFLYNASENFKLRFGANGGYYWFNPGEIEPLNAESSINSRKLDEKYAYEQAAYLSIEQQLLPKVKVEYGLRYSFFQRIGSQEQYTYVNNMPVVYDPIQGIYKPGQEDQLIKYSGVIKSFSNPEPRAAISYNFAEDRSIKAGYNRMYQYVHLISNASSPTPLDVWAPSGTFIDPQKVDQYSVEYQQNFKDGAYSLEVGAFYKDLKNRIDYIDGADLIAQNQIETQILFGEGRAYGLEILAQKNVGKWTGLLAYTLSKAEQRIPGRNANEPGINNGEWYDAPYDKTHDFSMTASYQYNDKWSFSGSFAFQTGRPVTYPDAQYEYQGITVPNYADRNSNRLPSYHHLDVSATLKPRKNKGRKWQTEWVFSIYNLYGRQNANSISFQQNDETLRNESVKLSIFGIVPSVTYNFKF
ncbi:TonB-dependent receptor [Aureivirga sp. CE67]|uniref:TonB-dependent receptor n=1 Tax=Aureivirga sp. CE67 TaxID=1788983 RepID=UPI0018CABE79|nr:TonB-dependent receptor [Aureivirga sp. CE67]